MTKDMEHIKPLNDPGRMIEGITLLLLGESIMPEDERIFMTRVRTVFVENI